MNNPSVISVKKMVCGSPNEWPWIKGHRSAYINHGLIRLNIPRKYYDLGLNSYRNK